MNLDVLEQVRQAVSDAQTAGEPAPGRPTLVKLTGAKTAVADLSQRRRHRLPSTEGVGRARQ